MNISKCQMTPVRYSDTELEEVQQVFPCRIQHFPCQYLGTPLSLSRLHRSDEQRLVDKVVARIPTWKSGLLNAAGWATLTQTTLSNTGTHLHHLLSIHQGDRADRQTTPCFPLERH
jgi:hypothetical protein